MNFLISNNLKFIIRVKGDAKYLTGTPISNSMKNGKLIKNIKKELRVVHYSNVRISGRSDDLH